MSPIYLDYNATTPIDPQVAEAMLPYLHQHFGNPSSSHAYGQTTAAAVERARGQLGGMLGCAAEEVIFTSGGTESNNHAIKGVAGAYRQKGNHIITSSVEHPAVLEAAVVGWEDTDRLVKPKAFVVLKEGQVPSAALAEELSAFVKARTLPHKYPRWVEFVAELPKTTTGKIQRYKLRAEQ